MEYVYIRKSDLNEWVAKYFQTDLISIEDLISTIEDLDGEVEHLKEEIEDMQKPKEPDEYDAYRDYMLEKEFRERG